VINTVALSVVLTPDTPGNSPHQERLFTWEIEVWQIAR